MKYLLHSILLIFLSSCSSISSYKVRNKASLTINTSPQGALVVCGNAQDYTPASMITTFSKEEIASGKLWLPACTIKWASGAMVKIKRKYINLNESKSYSVSEKGFQKGSKALVMRPNVRGYETDLNFALSLKKLKVTQRATRIREYSAREQASAIRSLSRPITCHKFGSTITCN